MASSGQSVISIEELLVNIRDQLADIRFRQDRQDQKLSRLETKCGESGEDDGPPHRNRDGTVPPLIGHHYSDQQLHQLAMMDNASDAHNPTGVEDSAVVAAREYEAVRKALEKVRLPADLQANDIHSQTGLHKDCRPAAKIVSKCGRFTETGIRWVMQAYKDNRQEDGSFVLQESDLQDLFNVFVAELCYVKAEYTNLVVQSTFDADTARYFKQFESNQSSFSARSLQNVRVAAELAAMANRHNNNKGRGRGRGFRGQPQRGRGPQEDKFSNLASRTMPSQRPSQADGNQEY